jgi:hypothetical protein
MLAVSDNKLLAQLMHATGEEKEKVFFFFFT